MVIAVWGSRDGRYNPLSSIRNTHDLRSWFITSYLERMGIEVDFYHFSWEMPVLKRPVDHLICTTNAGGLTRFKHETHTSAVNGLRPMVRGRIVEMSDRAPIAFEGDLFFTMTPEAYTNPNVRYIGWAADETICRIDKAATPCILVDHSLYVEGPDYSETVAKGLALVKRPFQAYQITNRGVQLMNLNGSYEKDMFDRKNQASYEEITWWYSRASLFIVTHAESLGISVIESAMAGAKIILYPGAIHEPLISPLQHSFYDANNPTDLANVVTMSLANLDPEDARRKAFPYSWQKAVQRLVSNLEV